MGERSSNDIMLQDGGNTNGDFLSCIKLPESTANIFANFLQSNPAYDNIQRPRVESQTKTLQIKSLNRKNYFFCQLFFFPLFVLSRTRIRKELRTLKVVDQK
eukprot:UN12823